jgi:hypothetical protein
MKRNRLSVAPCLIFLLTALLLSAGVTASLAADTAAAPNGISLPADYRDWRVISVSHRDDNKTLRVIIGNDTAINAARAGKTNPWPDGTVLGKLVWKDTVHSHWPTAIIPDAFVHAEFMVKESKTYKETGGWGFARWLGMEQKPFGADASFVQQCFGCHVPVKENDYVFTRPVQLP